MQKYAWQRKLSAITTTILPCYNIVCIFMPDLPMTFLKPEHLANLLPSSQAVLSHPAPSHWIPNVFSMQLLCSKFQTSSFILLLQLTCYRLAESKLTTRWVEVYQPRIWKET